MEALLFLLLASAIVGVAGSRPESIATPLSAEASDAFRPISETTREIRRGAPCWVCGRQKDGHEHR
jgi:hypothetical protein